MNLGHREKQQVSLIMHNFILRYSQCIYNFTLFRKKLGTLPGATNRNGCRRPDNSLEPGWNMFIENDRAIWYYLHQSPFPPTINDEKREKRQTAQQKKSYFASRFSITLIIDQTGCLVVHFIKNQITILIIRETYTNKKTYIYLCKYSRRTQTGWQHPLIT